MKVFTVGGMIGVGKTTYIQKLIAKDKAKGIKSIVVYELYEDRDDNLFREMTTRDTIMDLFLKLYYENVDKLNSNIEYERVSALNVTLGHQVNFLANRATKIIDAIHLAKEQGYEKLYLDRTIFEDLLFTKLNLFDNQIYWFAYMTIWDMWFNTLNHAIKGEDVTNIILVASEETILERIKKRGREMEQSPELQEYFKALNKSYSKDLIDNFISKGWDYKIIEND